MVIKKTIYAVLIICLAVVLSNLGMESNNKNVNVKKTDLELFLEKFAPPKELRDLIEKNKKDIKFGSILKGEKTSWICKGSGSKAVSRIINAWRCNKLIEKYNLDCLSIPAKYAYQLNGDIWVFAEAVEFDDQSKSEKILTQEEIRQLAFFAHKTNFNDWFVESQKNLISWGLKDCRHHHNIMQCNNKLVIIDTEDRSFFPFTSSIGDKIYYFEAEKNVLNSNTNFCVNPGLRKFLIKYDDLRTRKVITSSKSIRENTEFDDGINFEQIKSKL